jgi:hypothetical protein
MFHWTQGDHALQCNGKALDIFVDVDWTYIIRASHKAMHTCVEHHMLHSNLIFQEETLPTPNGRKVEPCNPCGIVAHTFVVMHVIEVIILELEMISTSGAPKMVFLITVVIFVMTPLVNKFTRVFIPIYF